MRIPDILDFDPRLAAKELVARGVTAVDDIGQSSYQAALEELMEELGMAVDDFDIVTDLVETSFGPVYVFRIPGRVSEARARALVAKSRSLR